MHAVGQPAKDLERAGRWAHTRGSPRGISSAGSEGSRARMSGAMADGWADIPDELSAATNTDDLLSITELSFIKQLGWQDLGIVAVVSLIPCLSLIHI